MCCLFLPVLCVVFCDPVGKKYWQEDAPGLAVPGARVYQQRGHEAGGEGLQLTLGL